jgi:hypothetical protein
MRRFRWLCVNVCIYSNAVCWDFLILGPVLTDFLSSSGSGTWSTQPRELREVNWGATWIKRSSGSRSRKQRITAVGILCADHVTTLYPQKLALSSPTCGGRSVGIVRSRTKATESLSLGLDDCQCVCWNFLMLGLRLWFYVFNMNSLQCWKPEGRGFNYQ